MFRPTSRHTRFCISLMLMILSPTAIESRPDLIFHVPEVLVRHAAVPRPVGTGRPNATRHTNDSEPWSSDDGLVQERYEYYVEHEISTADAKKAAMMLKVSEYPIVSSPPGCGVCSKRDLEYCETKVVADHCCCERRFLKEPFPWLPHTCYIGAERCTPIAPNCALYVRLRDCCCTARLAQRWKGILSKSGRLSASGISLMFISAVLFTVYL